MNAAGRWGTPVIGAVIGLAYGVVSQSLDFETLRRLSVARRPHPWLLIDTVVSVILPSVAGVLVGLLLNHARRQEDTNRVLSSESAKLRRHLLTQTLSAHILHEIRNPIHNLIAVLEDRQLPLPPEDAAILQDGLDRLRGMTDHLRRWTLLDDDIDVRAPVALSPWFQDFIVPKIHSQLQRAHIALECRMADLVVRMHPLLLEQCLVIFLNNAIEALDQGPGEHGLAVTARLSAQDRDGIEIEIRNTGRGYPETVLALQGSGPVESRRGLGLGLVIARRTLELVGGSFSLSNDRGHATAVLTVPGAAA